MKRSGFIVLFFSLMGGMVNACPFCVGNLDQDHKSPTFFSEQYEKYWNLAHQDNAHLLKSMEQESQEGELS